MFLFKSTLAFAMRRAKQSNQDTNYEWVDGHSPTHDMMTHLTKDNQNQNWSIRGCVGNDHSDYDWKREQNGLTTGV